MCASCFSLLLILLTSSIGLVTEGLPLTRQERGSDQDILAGADFLSVLLDSTAVQERRMESKFSTSQIMPTSMTRLKFNKPQRFRTRELRNPRSTHSVEYLSPTKFPSNDPFSVSEKTKLNSDVNTTKEFNSADKVNSSLIVSVHVSSSVSNSQTNKILHDSKFVTESKNYSNPQLVSELSNIEPDIVASEVYTSLLSDSNKSEFSVNEHDPITSGTEIEQEKEDYPAEVRTIPNPQKNNVNDNLEPFGHHSVVYHDEPTELIRGRSVSYSTVIQSLPPPTKMDMKETTNKLNETTQRERQNRHFEFKSGPNENNYQGVNKNFKSDFETGISDRKMAHEVSSSAAESNDYFVTATYESAHYPRRFSSDKQLGWRNQDLSLISESTPQRTSVSTEKYWEVMDKPREQQTYARTAIDQKRTRIPLIYGRPEQNYEVDESVSVMSNGRVHGIQANKIHLSPPQIAEKGDLNNDSQKVGYVVEGRNYRKYRVEERTSDGFIVGEYGVVSHDDGSLRGVRYTADGTTNPRLIYDALMKFLSL
ncbi:hypothetical protein RI129_001245 [Pyrocoelia pectoralis]|uniref:Uncharacterized protein n=1 Tax=Pyrocoelia pectoralis TaxID=417401 RepID=A0AAN7VT95_9COLE